MAIPLNFPANPATNETYRGTNNIVYVWQSNRWTSIGSIVEELPDEYQAAVTVGTEPPPAPLVGNLWYNTRTGYLFIWYRDEDQAGQDGQWVDVRPPILAGQEEPPLPNP